MLSGPSKLLKFGYIINIEGASERLYVSDIIPIEQWEHVLTEQDIPWSAVKGIEMIYKDPYGNNYSSCYDKG